MLQERVGAVTLKGQPYDGAWARAQAWRQAAEVALNNKGFDGMRTLLESTAGKVRLINVVPSLGSRHL